MDALIRAAQLAPFRMRLSETRAPARVPAAAQPRDPSAALREEIEKQVRTETEAQLRQLYATERERAQVDGRAEAQRAAAADIAQTREQLRTELESALTALERAHDEVLTRIESSVGEVAFAAVCRFVSGQAASRDFVLGLVEQACAPLQAGTVATARLHPRDIGLLAEMLEGGALRVQSIGLKLMPDESLPLGGCIIEAAAGQFDASLENQLRRLHAVLTANAGAAAQSEAQ